MRRVILAIMLLFVLPFPCLGEEITIQDTSGTIRSVAEVEDAGNVEFALSDERNSPAEGIEVSLTDEAGDTASEIAAGGLVLFEGIAPGVYTVSTTASGVTFTSISISSTSLVAGGTLAAGAAASGAGLSAGTVALGGAVVAAGATGAVAISNDDSNDPVLSPSS